MDLPAELRYQILEYTDLITPVKEVEWNPRDGYYMRCRNDSCTHYWGPWFAQLACPSMADWVPNDHVPCDQGLYHHSYQFRNCWQSLADRACRRGCFCRRHHAAYSLSTPGRQCICWLPPQPLFLVSKQLYQDAQFIFFSQNRIIITPLDGLWPVDYQSPSPNVADR